MLIGFLIALTFVFAEGKFRIPKSIPMGILMFFLGWVPVGIGNWGNHEIHNAFNHAFTEQSSVFFFLLGAIIMVHQIREEDVFETVKTLLLRYKLSFRAMFWIIAMFVFHLSPFVDNITSTLVGMGVIIAINAFLSLTPQRFLVPAITFTIVAANNGGAWSPLGDPPATMLWLAQILDAEDFVQLYWPAMTFTIVTGLLMTPFIPSKTGKALNLNPLRIVKEKTIFQYFSLEGK